MAVWTLCSVTAPRTGGAALGTAGARRVSRGACGAAQPLLRQHAMGMGLNLQARRKDGSVFPVEIGLSAIETAEGKVAIAFVNDIS